MKILITGGCGFVGTNLILFLKKKFNVCSLDNFSRRGSKYNYAILKKNKIKNYKFDISKYKYFKRLPKFDVIIDCCAEAAIEKSKTNFDKVINTNLIGTINILKKAKKDKSKVIFLSTSRVYPIKLIYKKLSNINLKKKIKIKPKINENDDIRGVKSIYGFTKLASEMLIEEFSYAFKLKYLINRCGVISGPLQFGYQDQGFVSLWVWNHLINKDLKYVGYGGNGNQIRDVLHVDDLCDLILKQLRNINHINNKIFTVGGSLKSSTSLLTLTKFCQKVTNNRVEIKRINKTSIYDIPYYITNNKSVSKTYQWRPKKDILNIVKDIYSWTLKDKNKLKKYF
jgi:CDP-paratose 2-epimerase